MKRSVYFAAACLPLMILAAGSAFSQSAGTIAPAFNEALPNVPGKSIIAVVVTYPPGGKTPPHHHAGSAFITGYVLSGAIRSKVDGGKVQVFKAGEHFTEEPGARHDVSENASTSESATLLAIFIVDSNDKALTTIDK